MREVCLRCPNGEKAIADKPPSKDICATYFMTRGKSRRPHHGICELNTDLVRTVAGDVILQWWGNDPRFYRRVWYSKSRCVKSFQVVSTSTSKARPPTISKAPSPPIRCTVKNLSKRQAWYLHRTLTKSCRLERSWLIQLVGCLRQWSWSCSGQRGSASKSSANDIRGSLCKLTKIKGLTFGQRDLRN